MDDHSELKRLAVELTAANDLFNESPQDNEIGDAWSLANDRFNEAASPEVILALIAENESLKGPHDWLAEDLIKELVDNAQSFQDNSDHGDSDPFAIVLLAAASRIRRQEVSIERFRAENAGLKTGYEAYEQVNAGLKAEVEWLRKDSESYRLLSFCHGQGTLELVRSHHELCAEIRRLKILAGEPVPQTPEEFVGPSPEGPTARIRRKLAALGKGEQS